MKVEDIVKGLKDAGYDAKECVNVKNGVNFRGICFAKENGLCPVVYTDDIIRQSNSVPEAVKKVLEAYNKAKDVDLKIDQAKTTDPAFIMQNVYIGLQKESNDAIVKKGTTYEGIEQFLYVRIDERASYKLSPEMIKEGDQAELWNAAEANTYAETKIMSMAAMFLAMEEDIDDSPMAYIVTNEAGTSGASAILDRKALEKFAKELGVHKFIVLPSSIHEMIIVPDKGEDISMFAEMVKDINQNHVRPEERLTDKAYVLEMSEIAMDKETMTTGDHGVATAGNYGTAKAGDDGIATAGNFGMATAGICGIATAKYKGTATAKNFGIASVQNDGTATAGYNGIAKAHDDGIATVGDYGAATAGDHGTAAAEYNGTAAAGDYGAATVSDYGTATAGYKGTATAGNHGTATAEIDGTATAGDYGIAAGRGKSSAGSNGVAVARGDHARVKGGLGAILVIAEENRSGWKAAIVDGKDVKADTWYRLNDAGDRLVKA